MIPQNKIQFEIDENKLKDEKNRNIKIKAYLNCNV